MLMKRGLKGGLPLVQAAKALQDEVLGGVGGAAGAGGVGGVKKAAIMILGLAMQTYGTSVEQEQEVLMSAADILMEAFIIESAVLRAERSTTLGLPSAALQTDAATVLLHDGSLRAEAAARTAIQYMTTGDTQRTMLAALRKVLKISPANIIAARRRLADAALERKKYLFA
jgi:hypothetical protein